MLACMNAMAEVDPPVDPDTLIAWVVIAGLVAFVVWSASAFTQGLTPEAALAADPWGVDSGAGDEREGAA